MDSNLLRRYVAEVDRQAHFADGYAQVLDQGLRGMGHPGSNFMCFAGAQGILTSGALVSKLFWVETGRDRDRERAAFTEDRAASLREALDPTPILKLRSVRNSVEHFDARLDDLLRSSPAPNMIDASIMPRSMLNIDGLLYLRHIDPETMTYSALDEEVGLHDVYDAIKKAGASARTWLDEFEESRYGR